MFLDILEETIVMKLFSLYLFFIPLLSFGQFLNPLDQNYESLKNEITFSKSSKKLHPSLLGGIKNELTGAALLSFGIVPQQRKPFLLFSSSSQKVKNQLFYFSLTTNKREDFLIDNFDRFFRGASSPKEFLLLKLNVRKDRRYIFKEKGSWRTKIASRAIPFTFEETEVGIFTVKPNHKLESGEYCFVHQDILTNPSFNDFAFFDFSIE
ncbi:hypothetical protein [Croceitalea sp. P059]|uniref:hypothetical protein n=1 Tax=Croceitalea sp. P059 TaxID=3075601 RepID=UPI0028845817|nr:hypothetical protein [Croceitalea sp. P059]MDT0539350.1 hypothetical protein [Croceitalea sp. P059]